MLVQFAADLRHHLLYVGPTHIHAYHDTPLGRIAVNLQRAVYQADGGHLAHRYLQPV